MGKKVKVTAKRWCALLLVAVMLCTSVNLGTITVRAENGGNCGEGVTWSVDATGETLTISGTGAVEDYQYLGTVAPWRNDYARTIKKVIIKSGVTRIGSFAFHNCTSLESVIIGYEETSKATPTSSLESIGVYAFYRCSSLSIISIPEGVTSIGDNAFSG